MICPFRVKRLASLTVRNEYTDRFEPCLQERCPCYKVEGDAKWCFRNFMWHPLNEEARKEEDGYCNYAERKES